MNRLRPIIVCPLIVVAVLATASVFEARQTANAIVQSEGAPVLEPDAALKTFSLPPGYRIELVASEPLIQDPIVIDWDPNGRLWAIEMPGYMLDIQATRELDPIGRVVVLEDTNADGRLDKRTVFAEGLVLPRALKVLDSGVLVAEPPNLWLMKDTNRDLRMDAKELVTDTYGRREANVEHNANSLLWALDNRIYTSEVATFLRWHKGKLDVQKTLSRGQWGASQDDAGRVYRNSNESALHVDLVPTQYFVRNPALLRTKGSYEFLGGPGDELNATWPSRPTPGVNRGYQTGVLGDDGRLATFTSVAAPTVYRGDRLPPDLYGNVFVVEPAANLVSRIIVTDTGATLRGRKAYERSEFLASTDERFRPVYLSSAPDGTLYVVDMYRGIIQHRGYITEYLRDQILARKLEQPTARGRIYRVVHATTRRDRAPSLSALSGPRLVDVLSHPNGWWRDTAQRLLVERNDPSASPLLEKLAASPRQSRTRLHALWTLDGTERITPGLVERALKDSSRDVRVSAIRLAERWLREPNHPLVPSVLALASDGDWAVREQLAASLGELPTGAKETALASLLESHAGDPVVMDAALSGLAGSELSVVDILLRAKQDAPTRASALTMLAATILASGQDGPVQALFERIADLQRFPWQRSALLGGAEVALLGATAPGSPAGRGRGGAAFGGGGGDPAATGARGGPGGAPAFPRDNAIAENAATQGGTRVGGRGGRGRGARPPLKVSREPALAVVAGDDLAARAKAVLARVEWPGKPGAITVVPLSAAEQARFDRGRVVYENLCVSCHQPNGQGREKLAPTLVASELAQAVAQVPVRILINGKEGQVGLMPPLGSVLSDEQIADVMTYVRRSWGNGASPIDAAEVARVRPLTAERTRPWTDAELARLAGGR